MANCSYCGKSAGFLKKIHPVCLQKHEDGKNQIIQLVEKVIRKSVPETEYDKIIDIAKDSFINDNIRTSLIISAWDNVVDGFLEDTIVSKEEESILIDFCNTSGLGQDTLDKNGRLSKITRAAVLRDILEGKLPQRIQTDVPLPINYQKGEQLIWDFPSIQYYEDRNKTTFVGRSHGVSVKIAKGLYYRTWTLPKFIDT